MRRLLATCLLPAALVLIACGGDDADDSQPAAQSPPTTTTEKPEKPEKPREPAERPSGTEIVVADSQYGSVLFDSDRRAIYLFDKETSDASECYGACAEAWPPVLTDGEPVGGDGIDAKLIGTTERDDGTTQVTYDGHPLYYYVDDPPGEVLCHNVSEFGGLWLVLEPSGEPVA
jgi:predicted lipoprotein with Yx(FWY)xxD motif